jgi:ornithine carbamoyltransferase
MADLSVSETNELIKFAIKDKAQKKHPAVLAGSNLALLFEKPSLRTRVSFEVAINQLGGNCLYLSPDEVGLGKREPVEDVASVLGKLVDGIIARTFAHSSVEALATYSGVPVINALSDEEHPCQALADILTIFEKKGKFKGIRLTYVGDGNNVANSLLLACVQVGIDMVVSSPEGYEINDEFLRIADEFAGQTGSRISLVQKPAEAVAGADVIYTDVWTSMGQEKEAEQRRGIFQDYQVNESLIALAKKDVIFMHPLPAHPGEEIAKGILRHPASVVFDQAGNRLHAQRALLIEMFSKQGKR